jgi:hypothetical protein
MKRFGRVQLPTRTGVKRIEPDFDMTMIGGLQK